LKKNKEILIATSNNGKIEEFENLLAEYKVVSLKDYDIEDAIEDGTSFLENALIKAKHGSIKTGLYSIADDSGLVVPKLNNQPGIYSARYAGNKASDKDNRDKIIEELNKTKDLYGHRQFMFPIVQGGTFKDLRIKSSEYVAAKDLPGNAIGGLSVGEPKEIIYENVDLVCSYLPKDKPRYLMGVGTPENI